MRNLKLQYCKQIAQSVPAAKFLLLDPNGGSGKNNNDQAIYIVTASKLYVCRSGGAAEELAELPGIVGAEYLSLDNEICLATAGGEVLVVNPQTRVVAEGTFCDVGIECMSWSPDQEVVAFITNAHNVVVMTCSYDPIAEHALADQCGGDDQFISVGWGKKETQFHGSAGKQAAREKIDFQLKENVEELPQQNEISWRADGAYFAVSFVCAQLGRMFKVFDKEGKLHFTSEKMNDLQPPIAWRPTGTWIAVPQQFPNKSTVALFEKNGLRHREIVLPFALSEEPIISFKWSADSDILAIHTETTTAHKLYLYTIGNYHWYLKQQLSFEIDDSIAVYNWDNKIGEEKTLHVLLQSGKYYNYKWHLGVDKFERSGVVAVIDGHKLLITDFAKTVVPPPMCNNELKIDANINACAFFLNDKEQLQLCIYDATHKIHLFQATQNIPTVYEKIATLEAAEKKLLTIELSNLCWHNENILIASSSTAHTSNVLLIALDIHAAVYSIDSSLPVNGIINSLCNGSAELDQFFAQTHEGKIIRFALTTDNNLKLQDVLYAQLEQPADQMQWYTSRNYDYSALIALKTNQCLYIDGQRIADDVSSFCLAGNYLAFTKLNALFFLRLASATPRTIVSERKIERGGKLITTISNDSRTILQMPRGNLEAINPRVLSLEIVAALLDDRRYHAAMDMLRKQRINLNIICDHNMCAFVENLDVFLREIQNPNWLNLFLSDLLNEDLTQSMYASNYQAGSIVYPEGFKIEHKVAYLCQKLCEHMEQNSSELDQKYRLPIITAYVKTGKLEKALELIWREKKNEIATVAATKHADDALKYLLYLVDVNELYNVALGTYDFGLVLFVAQKSQKDPKEFLPFLNELKTLELNYRKFKIDEHLRRYDKAMKNIAACGLDKFEEALTFIKHHALYQQALKYYEPDKHDNQQECYHKVCLAFGDYLRANGKLENASIMYERGGNLTQALLSAKHVLDWPRALTLARKDDQNVAEVALSLVASLQENGKYAEAFKMVNTYGSSFADALQCLLKGKLFLNAIFEARMQNPDLIESLILPDLLNYATLLESNLLADQELFISYKQRLLAIREKKAKLKLVGGEEDYENEVDEFDLLSDTTSMHSSRYTGSSRGTGKTFRSSKNRRKHERKLLSLKPGNPFEDIALIDALHNLIAKIVNQQLHIRDTCKALMELQQQDVLAAALQHRFKHMLTLVQESLDEIWIPEMMTAQQFLTGPNIDYTQLQNEQRFAMINPQKRFKPQLNIIDWEHEILR